MGTIVNIFILCLKHTNLAGGNGQIRLLKSSSMQDKKLHYYVA